MPRRCLIIADTAGWCFASRAQAIQKYAPPEWDVQIEYYGGLRTNEFVFEAHDVVLLLAPNLARQVRQVFLAGDIRVPLVVSYNSGIGRPGYSLEEVLLAADYVVVNNYAAWQHGRVGVRRYNACNISNGVDTELYRPTTPWRDRPKRALWTASKSKAEDAHDVKGYETVLRPLASIMPARYGIEPDFRIVDPGCEMSAEQMVDWYNSGRVLLCASRSEGTPNIALEAAACGCTVVTTRVGNMPELIRHGRNGFLVRARAGIKAGLLEFLEEIEVGQDRWEAAAEAMAPIIRDWDWSVRSRWYYALLNAVYETGAESLKPFSYINTPPEAVGA